MKLRQLVVPQFKLIENDVITLVYKNVTVFVDEDSDITAETFDQEIHQCLISTEEIKRITDDVAARCRIPSRNAWYF